MLQVARIGKATADKFSVLRVLKVTVTQITRVGALFNEFGFCLDRTRSSPSPQNIRRNGAVLS